MDASLILHEMGKRPLAAAAALARPGAAKKDDALRSMASALRARGNDIPAANGRDLNRGEEDGPGPAALARMKLTAPRVENVASDVAAAVCVNAPIRFTGGGAFGPGAEIGACAQRLHARGPIGAGRLTGAKYRIRGSGQVRR